MSRLVRKETAAEEYIWQPQSGTIRGISHGHTKAKRNTRNFFIYRNNYWDVATPYSPQSRSTSQEAGWEKLTVNFTHESKLMGMAVESYYRGFSNPMHSE